MKFRDHYFKREATIADSDTVIIDLNVKDPISYITVEYEATTGATASWDHELHDDISAIEIVDGSDVLASLSMEEWRGLNFVERGCLPHSVLTEVGNSTQEETCVLYFGRYPDDPEYYLDLTKFTNPQLRLTHNLTISASAGFTSGTGKITVMARIIEEGAAPQKGFMMAKQVYSWTSAASGDETIDLPRDYPYRYLLVKALLSTYRPDEILSRIKLSCDADKYVPINNYMEDIMDLNERRLGFAQLAKGLYRKDDDSVLGDIYDTRKAHIRAAVDDHMATVEAIDAEQVQLGLYDFTTPGTPAFQTTDSAIQLVTEGIAPHAMLGVFFGGPDAPEGWFPAPDFGDIKLYATQATANADCAIVLQQIRR